MTDNEMKNLGLGEMKLVSMKREDCKAETSFRGEPLFIREVFQTPVGLIERTRRWSGAALERYSSDWRLVPVEETKEAQARFLRASEEFAAAKSALEAFGREPISPFIYRVKRRVVKK